MPTSKQRIAIKKQHAHWLLIKHHQFIKLIYCVFSNITAFMMDNSMKKLKIQGLAQEFHH
jgi:hypothetical protein